MMVAVLEDGVFRGYISVEDAEGFFVSMSWLEMLYRLPDGRWVHVYESLAHLAMQAEVNHFPDLQQRDWFQPYLKAPSSAGTEMAGSRAASRSPDKETLAKALLYDDPGMTDAELARRLGVHRSTVGRWPWLQRFRAQLEAAREERPRGHRTDNGQVEAESWEALMDPDELDRYARGEMK
jgi:hypothetical protein